MTKAIAFDICGAIAFSHLSNQYGSVKARDAINRRLYNASGNAYFGAAAFLTRGRAATRFISSQRLETRF
ncbi:hypothetical protein [Nostoc sp. WHI]|uniref:hypothetical protein n=1 Tax=Nostoc sp. WHI TaxID=2650611 RepID=UPI0018C68CF8|nr:hypothetical protein [Nostoc sp. WHI]MBG1270285.1 hypothetical protein [Nostoc sp. WHI]